MEEEQGEYYDAEQIDNDEVEVEVSNYAEVLNLTQWGGDESESNDSGLPKVIAEYVPTEIATVSKNAKLKTKAFVNKVVKFITDIEGDKMTEETRLYLKDVAEIQITNISDLSYILTTNKNLIDNIIRKIDANQADDFVTINLYSTLVTQHLKLSKELNTAYRDLPSMMKRMRLEISAEPNNSVVQDTNPIDNQIITESFGESQFNSQKDLLNNLRFQQAENSQKTILNT